ncbi:hypothetical protein GGQ08_000122 [Salinibacter ruber]|uniref:hypothetical protein n=1 Tax=Salinibacter ruber TaxID=146919 RepID=UPI002167BFC8|nr:hypothetical protein [Salinibacter ruber]MCS3648828.1 hypothetical protein [Salinibacter ruber]MCS3652082.1 hypothetical protein [Salinibacter ruber]
MGQRTEVPFVADFDAPVFSSEVSFPQAFSVVVKLNCLVTTSLSDFPICQVISGSLNRPLAASFIAVKHIFYLISYLPLYHFSDASSPSPLQACSFKLPSPLRRSAQPSTRCPASEKRVLLGSDYASPIQEKLVRRSVGKNTVSESKENLEVVPSRLPIHPIQVQKNTGVKTESGFLLQLS